MKKIGKRIMSLAILAVASLLCACSASYRSASNETVRQNETEGVSISENNSQHTETQQTDITVTEPDVSEPAVEKTTEVETTQSPSSVPATEYATPFPSDGDIEAAKKAVGDYCEETGYFSFISAEFNEEHNERIIDHYLDSETINIIALIEADRVVFIDCSYMYLGDDDSLPKNTKLTDTFVVIKNDDGSWKVIDYGYII